MPPQKPTRYRLFGNMKRQRRKKHEQAHLLYDIELPLVKVLASMEIEGFKVDRQKNFRIFFKIFVRKISPFWKAKFTKSPAKNLTFRRPNSSA
ncbi:MAG: hypothetical protein L6V93_16830 [Clostridiales bacterium]|nr:MAG: hypothetical protein L6V93_16830 [Clostridiales bacterium]